MGLDNNLEQPSGIREKPTGPTPPGAKLNRILGASPGCRDLTPYEIELLRRAKQEIAQIGGRGPCQEGQTQGIMTLNFKHFFSKAFGKDLFSPIR